MSNDSDFTLRFRHKKKRYLEQVQQYTEEKKSRWDEFKGTEKDLKVLMKRVGAKKRNEVVSWGFDFGEVTKDGDGYSLRASAWANQNASNMHITGDEGELADLLAQFPELVIEGEYSDEYGRGSVSQTNQKFESSREDEDSDEDDDGSVEFGISGAEEPEFAAVHSVRLDVAQLADPPGTVINSVGMRLIPIPAGEFMMGGREVEEGYNAEEEQLHRVRINRPFLMGMYQVTQGEYASVVGQNPSVFHGKTRPVEHVSWREAAEFCRRLSDLPAEKAARRAYRLPTEAEWEYACRAGTETVYSFGHELTHVQANFCPGWVAQPQPTYPVAMFPPNVFGLFDMHGNVWEWCQDWYSPKYYAKSPVDDPPGPSKGKHHVLRGGSASVQAHECRSAIRGEAASDGPNPRGEQRFEVIGDFGLRVICEVGMGSA